MTVAWVVGGNGMLGTALRNALKCTNTKLFVPHEHFCWVNLPKLTVQLQAAVKAFATTVGNENEWEIYWAAGVGVMNSTEEELTTETWALLELLRLVESQPELNVSNGYFGFASSAGAIYAGASDYIVSENTPPAPTTAYAWEKIKQEGIINTFAIKNYRVTVLIARISTLYGSGQAVGKHQGLLAEIARRTLRKQPIQIYVPFDTIRDYITADDAAHIIITGIRAIRGKYGVFTKIVASEQPTTIAEIISIFKRITRRTPRIVTSANKLSDIYNRRIQFHSVVNLANEKIIRTSLFVGIAKVVAAELSEFTKSRS